MREWTCFHSNGLLAHAVKAFDMLKLFTTDFPAKPNANRLRHRRIRTCIDHEPTRHLFYRRPNCRPFFTHGFRRSGSCVRFGQFNPAGQCEIEEKLYHGVRSVQASVPA